MVSKKNGLPPNSSYTTIDYISTSLAIRLKKLLPGQYPISKKIQVEEEDYDTDRNLLIKTGKRVPHWQFPTLKECREHFEKLAKMKDYNWPEEPEVITEEKKPEF